MINDGDIKPLQWLSEILILRKHKFEILGKFLALVPCLEPPLNENLSWSSGLFLEGPGFNPP